MKTSIIKQNLLSCYYNKQKDPSGINYLDSSVLSYISLLIDLFNFCYLDDGNIFFGEDQSILIIFYFKDYSCEVTVSKDEKIYVVMEKVCYEKYITIEEKLFESYKEFDLAFDLIKKYLV